MNDSLNKHYFIKNVNTRREFRSLKTVFHIAGECYLNRKVYCLYRSIYSCLF